MVPGVGSDSLQGFVVLHLTGYRVQWFRVSALIPCRASWLHLTGYRPIVKKLPKIAFKGFSLRGLSHYPLKPNNAL